LPSVRGRARGGKKERKRNTPKRKKVYHRTFGSLTISGGERGGEREKEKKGRKRRRGGRGGGGGEGRVPFAAVAQAALSRKEGEEREKGPELRLQQRCAILKGGKEEEKRKGGGKQAAPPFDQKGKRGKAEKGRGRGKKGEKRNLAHS